MSVSQTHWRATALQVCKEAVQPPDTHNEREVRGERGSLAQERDVVETTSRLL